MVPHHPRCGGRPERCSRADDNKPSRVLPRRSRKAQEELVASGFSGKGFANYDVFLTIFTLRTFDVKNLVWTAPPLAPRAVVTTGRPFLAQEQWWPRAVRGVRRRPHPPAR